LTTFDLAMGQPTFWRSEFPTIRTSLTERRWPPRRLRIGPSSPSPRWRHSAAPWRWPHWARLTTDGS